MNKNKKAIISLNILILKPTTIPENAKWISNLNY